MGLLTNFIKINGVDGNVEIINTRYITCIIKCVGGRIIHVSESEHAREIKITEDEFNRLIEYQLIKINEGGRPVKYDATCGH
jgi:hypothetical protein